MPFVIVLSTLALLTCAADRRDTVHTGPVREAPAPKRTIEVRQWRQSTLVISKAPFEVGIRSLDPKIKSESFLLIRSPKDTLRLPTEPKGYVLKIYGAVGLGTGPDTTLKIGSNGTPSRFPDPNLPSR